MVDFHWSNEIAGCVPGPAAQGVRLTKENEMRELYLTEIGNIVGGNNPPLSGNAGSAGAASSTINLVNGLASAADAVATTVSDAADYVGGFISGFVSGAVEAMG